MIERRLSFFGKKISLNALWIDDNPKNVKKERSLLRKLGVKTTLVESTQEAINHMEINDFDVDLILSDIHRDENKREGLDLQNGSIKRIRNSIGKLSFISMI